jgi:hypothetical protein
MHFHFENGDDEPEGAVVSNYFIPATEEPGFIRLGRHVQVGTFRVDENKKLHIYLDENVRWSTLEELVAHASSVGLSVSFDLRTNVGPVDDDTYRRARIPEEYRLR